LRRAEQLRARLGCERGGGVKEVPSAPRQVKLDTGAYGQPGVRWLEVHELGPFGPGDSPEWVRVRMPDGEVRDFRVEEVESWRD
jgi:hypothetical protein